MAGTGAAIRPRLSSFQLDDARTRGSGTATGTATRSGRVCTGPNGGGPATYVEHGVTGILVDTGDGAALARSIAEAVDLAGGAQGGANAARARSMVANKFTIEAMASALGEIYRGVAVATEPVAWELSVS